MIHLYLLCIALSIPLGTGKGPVFKKKKIFETIFGKYPKWPSHEVIEQHG